MTQPPGGDAYPYELVDLETDAGPPDDPNEAEVAEGRRIVAELAAEARELEGPRPRQAASWRLAGALEVLRTEANGYNPGRDRASDGTVGDLAHASRTSDHNPNSAGVVRALDLDVDGLPLATAFERVRAAAAAGRLPQAWAGGYLILNRCITSPDWSRWNPYSGVNPHTSHGHVSASRTGGAGGYDSRAAWGVFGPAPTPPSPGKGWTGPDLTGSGSSLRGVRGNNGRRVEALQDGLRRGFPLYAKGLTVDGWWGGQTTAVLDEFGRRAGVPEADGLNIGPRLAAALTAAGVRP